MTASEPRARPVPARRAVAGIVVLALAALGGLRAAGAASPPVADPLAARGYHVTGGAAPGYVADGVCASCHPDLYDSYQQVGMARSFYRPRADNLIEDFAAPAFFHEPSRRYYRMVRRGDRLVMRRHQLDAAGKPINQVEQEVDWILGSGNHSRTYLYRSSWGELYQLPIAWYTQPGDWGMAPGFDRPDHLGLGRLVRRECMFCHNAYPEMAAGSDAHNEPHRFPAELPEGLGCQRCHGPGAEHARAAMLEPVDLARVFATIVNPGELDARLRDDVCYGCHMQPSVAIPGKRRFGRGDFSFRPGQPLSEYAVTVDVEEAGRERGERFEINHHPYRLEQSRCFEESRGELSCLTCHDPHRKVPAAERAAHYRAACLGCHEVDACRLDEMTATPAAAGVAVGDCVACHMPERRTQDVVRVKMTDHRIRRLAAGPDLDAVLSEADPEIVGVRPLYPDRAPAGALGEVYLAYTLAEFTGGRHRGSVEVLERLLPRVRPPGLEAYLALARGLVHQRRLELAREILEGMLAAVPSYPMAGELLGVAHAGLGNREESLATILEAVRRGRDRPEARYNLGHFLIRYGRPAEALAHLERAVEMRPTMPAAWFRLAEAQAELGRLDEAERGYRRALALEPSLDGAYLALGRLLLSRGRRDEALRYWRHGAEHGMRPAAIAEALAGAGE